MTTRRKTKPARVDSMETFRLIPRVNKLLAARGLELPEGYKIFAVNQTRGRHYPHHRWITIPLWALRDSRPFYGAWYISHELAHVFAWHHNNCRGHGEWFMYWLKVICPTRAIHYELNYKPGYARAAGIEEYVEPEKAQAAMDSFFARK